MAKRRCSSGTPGRKPAGKRLVDAGRSLKQARSMARDANAAARGDPGCPRGAKAVVRKVPGYKGGLNYEIWVSKGCRYV